MSGMDRETREAIDHLQSQIDALSKIVREIIAREREAMAEQMGWPPPEPPIERTNEEEPLPL